MKAYILFIFLLYRSIFSSSDISITGNCSIIPGQSIIGSITSDNCIANHGECTLNNFSCLGGPIIIGNLDENTSVVINIFSEAGTPATDFFLVVNSTNQNSSVHKLPQQSTQKNKKKKLLSTKKYQKILKNKIKNLVSIKKLLDRYMNTL